LARLEAEKATVTARDKIKEATDHLAEAETNLITPAMNAAIAQQNLADMLATGEFNTAGMRKQLEGLRDLYPELAGALDPYLEKLRLMQQGHSDPDEEILTEFYKRNPGAPRISATDARKWLERNPRAIGGPVNAGTLYNVNERKVPELFSSGGRQYLMPLTNGSITPMPNIPVRGGDGVTVGDIHVYGQTEPLATAYEVRRQLRAKPRMVARRG